MVIAKEVVRSYFKNEMVQGKKKIREMGSLCVSYSEQNEKRIFVTSTHPVKHVKNFPSNVKDWMGFEIFGCICGNVGSSCGAFPLQTIILLRQFRLLKLYVRKCRQFMWCIFFTDHNLITLVSAVKIVCVEMSAVHVVRFLYRP